jgi:soluble lytic murein transglycosylase
VRIAMSDNESMRVSTFLEASRAATLALACLATPAAADPADVDFALARDAYRAGDSAKLERVAPRLQGYLLEPYVTYWRLKLRIDDADPAELRAFIARYADMPLGARLRADWLKSLGKRGDWQQFGAMYVKRPDEDVELACYAIQWRAQSAGSDALDAARPFWFSGTEQPDACRPVFAAMLADGKLGPGEIWTRFRLAHEAGNYRLAAKIAAELPAGERPSQRDFDRIDRAAKSALAKGDFRFSAAFGRELALYALDRVAATDAASARDAFLVWRSRLPEADRLYGNLLVAYAAARQLKPQASDWYREAEGAPTNEAQRAWRARAALRAGSWSELLLAIDAMPAAEQHDPAWRYWKARALTAGGQTIDATRLYGSLAAEPHFYGLLAAEAIGATIVPKSDPLSPHPAELAAFAAQPAVQRTVKLSSLDLRTDGQREWLGVVRGLDDEALLLAAEFAQRNGLYDRSINTADRTRQRSDYTLRYPVLYRSELDAAAQANGLDPALVYGLVRQESRFVSDIVSSAGATGLMQLMPPTARWAAKQLGRPRTPLKLEDPASNAQLGAYYLRHVLDGLGGMPVVAAAAYNAGPGRARLWRGASPIEGAIYAETIPFGETRDYVKKVLANAMFYQAQLGLPRIALMDRLGVVQPRGASGDSSALDAVPEPADRPLPPSP